jgi:hypothetical protein
LRAFREGAVGARGGEVKKFCYLCQRIVLISLILHAKEGMKKKFNIRKRSPKKGNIRNNKPLLSDSSVVFRNLGFIYERSGYSWLDRFILNRKHKKALKKAAKQQLTIVAQGERTAKDLHKYYRVEETQIVIR